MQLQRCRGHADAPRCAPGARPRVQRHVVCRQHQAQRTEIAPSAALPAATRVEPAPYTSVHSYASYDDEYSASNLLEQEGISLQQEAARLSQLLQQLAALRSMSEKVKFLDWHPSMAVVRAQLSSHVVFWEVLEALPLHEQLVIKLLPVIGQRHVLALLPADREQLASALGRLAGALCRVDTFYDSMGGLVGYQLKSLELILSAEAAAAAAPSHPSPTMSGGPQPTSSSSSSSSSAQHQGLVGEPGAQATPAQQAEGSPAACYHVPPGLDLAGEAGRQLGQRAAAEGLLAMPYLAEILPVGGAGDRLGLTCDVTGQPLPSAMLPYLGRPILEGLLRDLQAREYLYWQLTGTQVTTPVAIMTSDAKGNHTRIAALMDKANWFGRGAAAFRLFRQPMVPVVDTATGQWLVTEPLKVMMKPGGHGAIWKLMHDEGVFQWFSAKGRASALIRQISNPMAGVDTTLLALAGTGFSGRRAFGFMSCERVVGAAEGMNVLQEKKVWVSDPQHPQGGRWELEYAITNVEYTEFERLGISDQAVDEGSTHSVFPANTNILYVGLRAAREAVEAAVAGGGLDVLPGLIFNLSKKVKFFDPIAGQEREVRAGRMECTMQNLADAFGTRSTSPLPSSPGGAAAVADRLKTFMVYNLRRKVTSSAKKKRVPGSTKIHQTPEGAFYDLQRNGWQVLQRCGLRDVPEVGSVEQYLAQGPGFIFLFHPALGPLWDVIAQKIRGGSLLPGSELVLEVAEARLLDVKVDGSLLVTADAVMGHLVPAEMQQPQHTPFELPGDSSTVQDFPVPSAGANGVQGGQGQAGGWSGATKLAYSSRCGRVHLLNVSVENVGVDWHHPGNVYWHHQVQRHEACRIILHGRAEFEAYDCRIRGDQVFEVPDGYRMLVTAGPGSSLSRQLLPLVGERPTWEWRYAMDTGGAVKLEFVRNAPLDSLWSSLVTKEPGQGEEEPVLDWVI